MRFLATLILAVVIGAPCARAETPDGWIALGTKVHGGFGAFIPLGIQIGLDAMARLNAKPREVSVVYFDSAASPCACFADGIAIATTSSVGQRSLIISKDAAPPGVAAVAVIRRRTGGDGLRYMIPLSSLGTLRAINENPDPRARWDAVMAAKPLFSVEPIAAE